jgi:hypothetical protein
VSTSYFFVRTVTPQDANRSGAVRAPTGYVGELGRRSFKLLKLGISRGQGHARSGRVFGVLAVQLGPIDSPLTAFEMEAEISLSGLNLEL